MFGRVPSAARLTLGIFRSELISRVSLDVRHGAATRSAAETETDVLDVG